MLLIQLVVALILVTCVAAQCNYSPLAFFDQSAIPGNSALSQCQSAFMQQLPAGPIVVRLYLSTMASLCGYPSTGGIWVSNNPAAVLCTYLDLDNLALSITGCSATLLPGACQSLPVIGPSSSVFAISTVTATLTTTTTTPDITTTTLVAAIVSPTTVTTGAIATFSVTVTTGTTTITDSTQTFTTVIESTITVPLSVSTSFTVLEVETSTDSITSTTTSVSSVTSLQADISTREIISTRTVSSCPLSTETQTVTTQPVTTSYTGTSTSTSSVPTVSTLTQVTGKCPQSTLTVPSTRTFISPVTDTTSTTTTITNCLTCVPDLPCGLESPVSFCPISHPKYVLVQNQVHRRHANCVCEQEGLSLAALPTDADVQEALELAYSCLGKLHQVWIGSWRAMHPRCLVLTTGEEYGQGGAGSPSDCHYKLPILCQR